MCELAEHSNLSNDIAGFYGLKDTQHFTFFQAESVHYYLARAVLK